MPIFHKCPFVWCQFPQVLICLKYLFSPRANLPQVPIYFGAHLPQMLICPKCPFTPNSPYLPNIHLPRCPRAIVPTISLNPHLSRCTFAPSTHLSGIYLSGTQMYGPQLFGTMYPGAHLSVTQMYGLQLSGIHLPGAHLSWCPFILVLICTGPKCPKTACYTPHLH